MGWQRFAKHLEYTDAHFLFCFWGLARRKIPFKTEVVVACGRHQFKVDTLAYHNVVIEHDGESHDAERRREKDEWKDRLLREHGFKVLRFTDSQVHRDFEGCLDKVEALK